RGFAGAEKPLTFRRVAWLECRCEARCSVAVHVREHRADKDFALDDRVAITHEPPTGTSSAPNWAPVDEDSEGGPRAACLANEARNGSDSTASSRRAAATVSSLEPTNGAAARARSASDSSAKTSASRAEVPSATRSQLRARASRYSTPRARS